VSQLTPHQGFGLVQHFQHVPRVLLSPGGVQNRPHGRDRAAVCPDHLPDVVLRDPQVDDERGLARHPVPGHGIWVSHHRFRHVFDQFDDGRGVISVVITRGSPPPPCAPAGPETTRASGGAVSGRWGHLAQPPVPHGRLWRAAARTQDSADRPDELESPGHGRQARPVRPGARMRPPGGRPARRHGTGRVAPRNARSTSAPGLFHPRPGSRARLRTGRVTKYI
jgi:hypothetical protein